MVKLIKGGIVTSDHVDEGFVHKFYTDAKADARANLRISSSSISALADVDTITVPPETGQTLVWDGYQWVPGISLSDNPTFNSVTIIGEATNSNHAVTKNYVDSQIDSQLNETQSGSYTHTQDVATIEWTVHHNLGARFVDVQLIRSDGTAYDGRFDYPTITYTDADTLIITFSSSQTGWAVVSHGVTVIGDVTELAYVAVSGSYLDLRDTPSIRESGSYTHTQDVAATEWTIHHNLGARFVDIQLIRSDGTAYDGRFDYPTITYTDADTLIITFSSSQTGWAVVSHGVTVIGDVTELAYVAVSGSYLDLRDTPSIRESGSYTHTQDVAATEWTIHHNLGARFVDIQLIRSDGTAYDGRFDYPTITYIDADTLTVTFSDAQAGWAIVSHGVTVIGDVTELANVAVSGSYLDLRDIIEEPKFLIKNSNFVAATGKRYGIDTTNNNVTVTLPTNPARGEAIFFTDAGDNLQINPLFIKTQGHALIKFCGEYYGNGVTHPVFEHAADSMGFFWTGSFWMPYGITTFQ